MIDSVLRSGNPDKWYSTLFFSNSSDQQVIIYTFTAY
jgi:hypothetical protein